MLAFNCESCRFPVIRMTFVEGVSYVVRNIQFGRSTAYRFAAY